MIQGCGLNPLSHKILESRFYTRGVNFLGVSLQHPFRRQIQGLITKDEPSSCKPLGSRAKTNLGLYKTKQNHPGLCRTKRDSKGLCMTMQYRTIKYFIGIYRIKHCNKEQYKQIHGFVGLYIFIWDNTGLYRMIQDNLWIYRKIQDYRGQY